MPSPSRNFATSIASLPYPKALTTANKSVSDASFDFIKRKFFFSAERFISNVVSVTKFNC